MDSQLKLKIREVIKKFQDENRGSCHDRNGCCKACDFLWELDDLVDELEKKDAI